MNKRHKNKEKKTDSVIMEGIQSALIAHLEDEFSVAVRNAEDDNKAFDKYYDMIHCLRTTKPNEWESDIFLPEFVSRLLTQVGNFVHQYFGSRDFVDNYTDSDDPVDVAEAKASKRLLNAILNDQGAYYYQKIVRLLMFCFTSGKGIIKGGYEQTVEKYLAGYEPKSNYVTDESGQFLATDGSLYYDTLRQQPMKEEWSEPIYKERVVKDTPIFDVYPNNSVYTSPEYSYSLNNKEYVIFESEMSLAELKKSKNEYFNLDLLGNENTEDYQDKTYGKNKNLDTPQKPVSEKYIVLERWGKYPVDVIKRDEYGKPVKYNPGIDSQGEFIEGSENLECIITTVKHNDSIEHLIGFRISPHSSRPMVRFLCYIDPLKDDGFGDGEMNSELQIAINDNYNLGNYRTKLAVTPAFKSKKFSGIDPNLRITPEKTIEVENMEDLQEFVIQDNIQGTMIHHGMLTRGMDYAMSTSPQTMGQSSERKETATQASITAERANVRIGMKSMNLEFIGFTEFYQMILTLANDFMLPETLLNLVGQDAYHYRPDRKDKFKPVSQALETEDSKQFKIKMWDQVLGRVVGIPNPKTPMMVNYIMGQVLELMGGDFKHFKKFMLEDSPDAVALYQLVVGGVGVGSTPNASGGGPQNQTGMPQSGQEQAVRGRG